MGLLLKTVTLGCKVNQYETEFVRQGLLRVGYRDAGKAEVADLCLVNTCTVTREGDAKSRQMIRRLARENPGARIIVMGCYATRAPQEVESLPGVTDVVTDKRRLPQLLEQFGVVDVPTGISEFGSRHRAYLKVQDGCYLRCTYCIIPLVRQAPFSRPVDEILEEAERLIQRGYRELVLTGVHLGHYGVDRNAGRPKKQWVRLSDLVRSLIALPGDFRVRLSSIEATEVTPALVDLLQQNPQRICPHVHVCLQSGSNRILRAMRRRWPVETIIDRCRQLMQQLDLPSLTTDVIVGFPGETEQDFEQTCSVVQQMAFAKVHVFPFSPRAGTPAAEMPDQIPKPVRSARAKTLIRQAQQLRTAYFQRLVGKRLRVLVESPVRGSDNQYVGTAGRYVPVQLTADASMVGRLVDCTAKQCNDQRLYA